MATRLVPINVARCVSLLKAGKTQQELANDIGVHLSTMNRRLRAGGFRLGKSQKLGRSGEAKLAALLRKYGREVITMPSTSPFDFLVDGSVRVEVKTAARRKTGGVSVWRFNFHRHGLVSEKCDFYILRLQGVPDCKAALHLLLKAPRKRNTLTITIRSFMNGMGQYTRDFQHFARHGVDA